MAFRGLSIFSVCCLVFISFSGATASVLMECEHNLVNINDRCYLLNNNDIKKWEDAGEFCQRGYGDLAQPVTAEENENIKEIIRHFDSSCSTHYWFGLRRDESTLGWTFINNVKLDYSDWAQFEPNEVAEKCALYKCYSGVLKWNNATCSSKGGFVCQLIACPETCMQDASSSSSSSSSFNELPSIPAAGSNNTASSGVSTSTALAPSANTSQGNDATDKKDSKSRGSSMTPWGTTLLLFVAVPGALERILLLISMAV